MPVAYDSSVSRSTFPFNTAAGSQTWTHNVNPNAQNVQAFVAILWTGTVTVSGTFAATFGGNAMTNIGTVSWNAAKLTVFQYASPAPGANTVVASFSGMPTSLALQNFFAASVTYANVQSVGTPVLQTAPGTGTTSNSVTVASNNPCDKVVSFHGTGTGLTAYYTHYTGNPRANPSLLNGGQLAIQDAPGTAGNVTNTATAYTSTNWWGAIGLDLVPTPVIGTGRGVAMGMGPASGIGGLLRVSTPPITRTWRVAVDTNFNTKPGNWWPTGALTPQYSAAFEQGPNSVLDYGILFDVWMAQGDTLSNVAFTEPTGAITVLSQNINADGKTAVGWLQGGTSPGTYIINVHVTTTGGRQDDRQFALTILDGQ